MKNYQQMLSELLQLTEQLYLQVKQIHSDMKENQAEQLEEIQALVDERDVTIKQLDAAIQQPEFNWSKQDQVIINQIKEYQQMIQPRMNKLYQSFSTQMNIINQRKQMSKKYIGAYQTLRADGSFIDKRK